MDVGVPGYVDVFLIFVKAIPTCHVTNELFLEHTVCRRGDVLFLFLTFHVKILAGRIYEYGFSVHVISLPGVQCVLRPSASIFGKLELTLTVSTAV